MTGSPAFKDPKKTIVTQITSRKSDGRGNAKSDNEERTNEERKNKDDRYKKAVIKNAVTIGVLWLRYWGGGIVAELLIRSASGDQNQTTAQPSLIQPGSNSDSASSQPLLCFYTTTTY